MLILKKRVYRPFHYNDERKSGRKIDIPEQIFPRLVLGEEVEDTKIQHFLIVLNFSFKYLTRDLKIEAFFDLCRKSFKKDHLLFGNRLGLIV